MKISIPFLPWAGRAALEIEIADDTQERFRLRAAVEIAVGQKANLRSADLGGANLGGANLRNANLRNADLGGANLGNANLGGANLGNADLRSADLGSANLRSADLRSANLGGANLGGANLRNADLGGANLGGANLGNANLGSANLRSFRADIFDILLRAQPEVPFLLGALRAGKIDGSTYQGACACLCGTIANARSVDIEHIGFRDSSRPAEVWFMNISPGHRPDNHEVARITEGWILEFMGLVGIADPGAPVATQQPAA